MWARVAWRTRDELIPCLPSRWEGLPMCGRYVLKAALPDIARMLGMDVDLAIDPRYNIAPTTCRDRS